VVGAEGAGAAKHPDPEFWGGGGDDRDANSTVSDNHGFMTSKYTTNKPGVRKLPGAKTPTEKPKSENKNEK
jgi:hypothetical protein